GVPRRADEGDAPGPLGRPGAPVPAERDHVPRRPEPGPRTPGAGTMTARAPYDVVVVGLGLAGLVAGLAAASRGASVLVVGKGHGTLRFRTGTVDVLGYREGRLVTSPGAEVRELADAHPDHPYALAQADLADGLAAV